MIEFRKNMSLELVSTELGNITEKIKNKSIPKSPEISEKISQVNEELTNLLSELEGAYGFAG